MRSQSEEWAWSVEVSPAAALAGQPPREGQRAQTVDRRAGILRDAIAIVEVEYARDLCLSDLAHRVAASPRQLQRCYAEIGRTTFSGHLTAVRMQRAAELLAGGTITVREAARRVAYPHPAQFTKSFRRYHGVTPSDFRASPGAPPDARPRAAPAPRAARRPRPPADPRDSIGRDAIDRRITSLLRLYDHDHDDVLDAFDFEEWVDRLGALRGWEPGCDGYRALTHLFIDGAYRGVQATSGRDDGTVTLVAMRAALRAIAGSQPEQAVGWADALFDLLDGGRSGDIDRERYRDLLASLSIPRSVADASFARLDVHARGRLSRGEFRALYLGFFLDVDPDAAAAWFWGPPALHLNPQSDADGG